MVLNRFRKLASIPVLKLFNVEHHDSDPRDLSSLIVNTEVSIRNWSVFWHLSEKRGLLETLQIVAGV